MAPSQVRVAWSAYGGQPPKFRFPVTWAYLAEPAAETQVKQKTPEKLAPRAPVPRVAVPPPATTLRESRPKPAADSWEMVIPRTDRPGPRRPQVGTQPVSQALS